MPAPRLQVETRAGDAAVAIELREVGIQAETHAQPFLPRCGVEAQARQLLVGAFRRGDGRVHGLEVQHPQVGRPAAPVVGRFCVTLWPEIAPPLTRAL